MRKQKEMRKMRMAMGDEENKKDLDLLLHGRAEASKRIRAERLDRREDLRRHHEHEWKAKEEAPAEQRPGNTRGE